jgi:hypothetical protein
MPAVIPRPADPVQGRPIVDRRALSLWPRLDHRALARCHHDLDAVARLVSRRTSLPIETIRALLAAPAVPPDEAERWFG